MTGTTPTISGSPGGRPDPARLRAELEALVVTDLLGPAGGPEEEIPISLDRVVRDRYILGILAPTNTVAIDPERADSAEVEGNTSPDLPTDDEPVRDALAAKAAMFPSSIGMSFALEASAERLCVRATWGRYEKRDLEPVADQDQAVAHSSAPTPTPTPSRSTSGRRDAQRIWKRVPVEGRVEIPLAEGPLEAAAVTDEQPAVVVRGRVSRRAGYWLVSLFLVNEQEKAENNSDERWLFQATLSATAPSEDHPTGAPLFVGRQVAAPTEGLGGNDPETEIAQLDMAYRHHVEFAAGHGTAVHAVTDADAHPGGDPTRAVQVATSPVPACEVPRTEAPTAEEEPALADAVFDMKALAEAPDERLREVLEPLVRAYERWLERQEERLGDPAAHLDEHRDAAERALGEARATAKRLRAGIDVLAGDPDAATAFRFANEAMWQQRIHTLAASQRPPAGEDEGWDPDAALDAVDVVRNRSWRPFQLAFILLNVAALVDPSHRERRGDTGLVDLLFFPTGGGKTEAYLGLTAFTLAIRRLQGTVAGHDGEGVAVLMRYTLRLLTSQQFQRATALICACEVLRRAKVVTDERWGETPFRIGLWVGSALAPNRGKEAQAFIENARSGQTARGASPVQLSSCPWCGRVLTAGTNARYHPDRWRTLLSCGDPLGRCAFTEAASDGEGLPVVTVDEELYRLLPALVISTADKWAQLPLRGPLHLLFGRATRRCTRHGYRSADLDRTNDRTESDTHRRTRELPEAKTLAINPLRPPDLIIQDELHLISGPLGTLVGLYETAIDALASWQVDGVTVRPKVVASTATVRRAAEQVHALFWRGLEVFPPPVLDVEDSFFARQRPPTERPGRRYVGICAPGQRMASVETRVFTTVLAAGQKLYDKYGAAADPWMTMVGYFSALRELGGAKRLIEDDVRSRLRNAERRGLAKRTGMIVRELTSRVASSDIAGTLADLALRHDPAMPDVRAIDVVLATNMISVGVDVARLGLMVGVGQPKATAEYIQATSRVGRSEDGPGLVFTIYNWARPRDLSHYETFEHYHASFYRHVEALSVTPFAPRAIDRGLTAVLVALLRQQHLDLERWNHNDGAQQVEAGGAHPVVAAAVESIVARAEDVSGKVATGQLVRDMLAYRLAEWEREKKIAAGGGATLGYEQKATTKGLLTAPTLGDWPLWAVPSSMRETEPNVNLIIDEKDWTLDDAPAWTLGAGTPTSPPSVTAEDGAEEEDGTEAGTADAGHADVGAWSPRDAELANGEGT